MYRYYNNYFSWIHDTNILPSQHLNNFKIHILYLFLKKFKVFNIVSIEE